MTGIYMRVGDRGNQMWIREQEELEFWVPGLATWVGGGILHRGRIIRRMKFFSLGREGSGCTVEN